MSSNKSSPENLTSISTFVCVGESTSLTAAAQRLQMSVSGVSKALSRLEDRLRVRLLNRTSRSITLTPEGHAYFLRCKQILSELEEAEAEITDGRAQPRGRLRIQLPRAIGKKIVVPALPSFLETYPEIAIDVLLDARSRNLEENAIDVALRYGISSDSPLVARRLCCVYYVACASPDYLSRYGEPKTLDDLVHHRCINYLTSDDGRYRLWNFSAAASVSVSGLLNVNDMAALTDAALKGAGIAYLTDFMVADYIVSGELKVVLPAFIYEGAPVYMVYPKRRYPSSRSRAFRSFLATLFPATPPWSEIILAHKSAALNATRSATHVENVE
jgi:LysR family transcriptional regulator, regulator for bpeEF and oprC